MSDMSPLKRKIIQFSYFCGQFASIGAAFSGSMLGIHDYIHPDNREYITPQDYIWIFGLGLGAAIIGSFTAHKFQGQKIGAKAEDHNALPDFDADLSPQNWKSKLAESSYLFFAFALSVANNYLLVAGLNAFFKNSSQAILPPGSIGITIFMCKTFFLDMPFDGTSAIYEASEEIKEMLTDSKAGTLLSQFFRPLAVRPSLLLIFNFWIQTAGVCNHTGSDTIGFILSVPSLLSIIPGVPPVDTINDFTSSPGLMYPLLTIAAVLFVLNCIQTLYFEATESKNNLNNLDDSQSKYDCHPLIYRNKTKKNDPQRSVIRKLLLWAPRLKKPIRYGFYTQGPLHAFGDLMPVVLLLRDLYDRHNIATAPLSITSIIILSAIVFVGSCWGTHHSEVTTAIHHFDEEFRDINPSHSKPSYLGL